MQLANLVRYGGLAAMLGSVLGILVAPVVTSAYSMTEHGAEQTPSWEPTLSNLLGPFLTFAQPETVYAAYGKVYFLVFLGFLLGLASLYSERRGRAGRLERWGFRFSFAGLVLNLFGNIPDYWIGEDTIFEEVGFLVGTALGLLILAVGSLMLGIALLRAGAGSRLGAWLLALALPGMALLGFIGFGNIPSGPALWFCFAWLVLGHFLWSREGNTAQRTTRAA